MIISLDYMRRYHQEHLDFCKGGILYKPDTEPTMCEFCRVRDCNFYEEDAISEYYDRLENLY